MRWAIAVMGWLAIHLGCAPTTESSPRVAPPTVDVARQAQPDAGVASPVDAGVPDAGTAPVGGMDASGCPHLFAQDLLPTYRVEIAPAEWAKLQDEFLNYAQRKAAGLDLHPWHPIVFRYRDEVFPTAMIRLKGKSSWELAVARDPNPKMQFVISFNEVDRKGRFHGLRKIVLDMPRNDQSFVRQRLALAVLRDLGIPAQCANNARLEINGVYYGLYANLEHMDKEFLQRVFLTEDEGDLWKGGVEPETNEETANWERRNALFAAKNVEQIEDLGDLEASLWMWAVDALLPNGDGYYAGTLNFQLYDHPRRGFIWLPYDLDGTFVDFIPADADPISWKFTPEKAIHWSIVLGDPVWRDRYVAALEKALADYEVRSLEKRVAEWSAQIRQAASEDPNKPFSMRDHEIAVRRLSAFFSQRAAFMRRWLDCRRGGGADPDGDGATWCFDCDERDPTVRPGAAEVCGNTRDDSCDGRIDERCG